MCSSVPTVEKVVPSLKRGTASFAAREICDVFPVLS